MKIRIMVLSLLVAFYTGKAFSSFNAYDFEVDGMYFAYTDKEDEVAFSANREKSSNYHDTYSGDIVIPSTVVWNDRSYKVTSIQRFAFYENPVTSVEIPSSIIEIGDEAFYRCDKLLKVKLSEGLKTIGSWAFMKCSSLTEITIPSTVECIRSNAFFNCTSLDKVNISDIEKWMNIDFESKANTLEDAEKLYLNGNLVTTVEIPSSMKKVKPYVFTYCRLKSVTVGEGVEEIGERAFSFSETLMSVKLPSTLKKIGDNAFTNCTNLFEINTPPALEFIGEYAFNAVPVQSLELPNTLVYLGVGALGGMRMETLTIPGSVKKLPEYLCQNGGIKSIRLEEGIEEIDYRCFYYCSGLNKVFIPSTLKYIGDAAFEKCSNIKEIHITDLSAWCRIDFNFDILASTSFAQRYLYINGEKATDIVIPDDVTEISDGAFACSNINSVKFPNSITEIPQSMFAQSKLQKLEIGYNVSYIGSNAFYQYGKDHLKQIICHAVEPPMLGSSVFTEDRGNIKLLVPFGSGEKYRNEYIWKDFAVEESDLAEVEDVECGDVDADVIYNLQGIRLESIPDAEGIYIVNGKKILKNK